jgi:hypothetical protein
LPINYLHSAKLFLGREKQEWPGDNPGHISFRIYILWINHLDAIFYRHIPPASRTFQRIYRQNAQNNF